MKLRVAVLMFGAWMIGVQAQGAKVVGVIDGDTIRVEEAGSVRTIHVAGVDTPNAARPKKPAEYYGTEAVDYTQKNLLGKEVKLTADPGMPQGEVYVELADGKDLGAELVRQGFAYAKPECSRCKELKSMERKARGSFAGLWHPDAYKKYEVAKNKEVRYLGTLGDAREIQEDSYGGEDVWVILFFVY